MPVLIHFRASSSSAPVPGPAGLRPGITVPLILALALVLPEAILLGADHGFWGSARWRPFAYQNGAFWAGLLHGWRPNFTGQPELMFLSYAFLHSGPGHLIGNLGGLAWLEGPVLNRFGRRGFLAVWFGAGLGGALAFGLLATSPAPMVGASGAVFGLAGAWIAGGWRRARERGQAPRAAARRVLTLAGLLVLVNVVSWVWEDGLLAWQTHLGGFAVGAALGLVLPTRK